jgi:putative drug exporter of the RND superfamily
MPLASLVGRLRSWLVLLFAVALSGAAFALIPADEGTSFPASGLADTVESAQVAALLEDAPSGETTVGIVVITRTDGGDLGTADIADATDATGRLADLAIEPRAVVPVPSDDGSAVLVVVPLDRATVDDDVAAAATELRDAARDGLPDGLDARLSGPVGFQADISAAFAGADFRLLGITAAVVNILLIITHRSPVL